MVGAGLLLVFLVLATYFFHDFWTFEDAAEKQQIIQFMKNLALMGAVVHIKANCPGPMSMDAKSKSTNAPEILEAKR
ncbi:MAG: DoxX family protein [Planctomycetota bacterium]|nr:DoxX family protein [Planctomycetota bacterium]